MDSFLKDTAISDCRKIKKTESLKKIKIKEILLFIRHLEAITGLKSSLSPSENGLIYLTYKSYRGDLKKWKMRLNCN